MENASTVVAGRLWPVELRIAIVKRRQTTKPHMRQRDVNHVGGMELASTGVATQAASRPLLELNARMSRVWVAVGAGGMVLVSSAVAATEKQI